MAWNGSGTGGVTGGGKKSAANNSAVPQRAPSAKRGLLAGVLIVVAAACVFLLVDRGENSSEDKSAKPSRIVDAGTNIVRKISKEKPVEKKVIDPNARPTKAGEVVNGYILTGSGRMHKIRGAITNNIGLVKADYEIFDHYCENEIACLLSLKPGDTIVGDPSYRGDLIKDFIESLKHPIIVKEDDSERDKELKRAVIATKIELKEAMDRGENIEQIMLDTRAECRRLAEYKRMLQEEVREKVRDGELSSEDFQDYVAAANKMLEAKGISPLRLSPVMKRKLMMDVKLQKKEE